MVNEDECRAAGLDPVEVQKITRRLQRAVNDANALGLQFFGGAGSGSLRFRDSHETGALICADIDGDIDGGAGAGGSSPDGLQRGEHG